MVHLRIRQCDARERLAPVDGDAHTAVVAHHEAVGIRRVPPDVVQVTTGTRRVRHLRDTAIAGAHEAHADHEELVRITRTDTESRVVLRTLQQVVIAVHRAPAAATVIRAIERRLLHLDQRVQATCICARHADGDLAHRALLRQSLAPSLPVRAAIQAHPRVATVTRHPETTACAAGVLVPRHDVLLPAGGEEHARVGGIHRDVDDAGAVIHEQHLLPLPAPVDGAPEPTIRLRPVAMSLRGGIHDVRVGRMNEHAPDAARVLQSHAIPVLPRVGRTIDAIADGDVAAQEGLTGAEPDDVRIAGRHRHRADRRHAQRVGHRHPARATIRALEQATTRGTRVVRPVLARHTGHGNHAIAIRTDEAPARHLHEGGVEPARCRSGTRNGGPWCR